MVIIYCTLFKRTLKRATYLKAAYHDPGADFPWCFVCFFCVCVSQTILLLSMLRAVVIMGGKGELPSDGESEQLSLRAYDFLDHMETGEHISKKDFLKVHTQTHTNISTW